MTSVYKIPLSAADLAVIATGGTLSVGVMVTPTVVVVPPPPPVPVVGDGVIYADGVFHWKGDWNGAALVTDYANKTLIPGKTVAQMTSKAAWAYWLPYILHMDTTPYANLILKIKPAFLGQGFGVAAYTSTSSTTDIVTGGVDSIAPYAGSPDADGVITHTIPLSALKAVGIDLYKIIVQDKSGKTGDVWGVAYAAFV